MLGGALAIVAILAAVLPGTAGAMQRDGGSSGVEIELIPATSSALGAPPAAGIPPASVVLIPSASRALVAAPVHAAGGPEIALGEGESSPTSSVWISLIPATSRALAPEPAGGGASEEGLRTGDAVRSTGSAPSQRTDAAPSASVTVLAASRAESAANGASLSGKGAGWWVIAGVILALVGGGGALALARTRRVRHR